MSVEIADWNDLDNVRDDLDGDYVLVNDLDSETTGYDTVAGPDANSGDGFEPIGPLEVASGFSGNFDGQDYEISDLIIDRRDKTGERYTAIFTRVTGATIENLRVENVDIKVDSEENTHAVIIGGDDDGFLLQNCSTTGSILQTGSGERVGGMVGQIFSAGTIENCVSHVDVTSDADTVGGLVSYNDDTVTESYATGSVEGDSYVGGLVGRNHFTVTESYATGSVEGDSNVGGLVGRNDLTVTESYATGSVEGDSNVGGLVGRDRVGPNDISNSYADSETTSQSVAVGNEDDDEYANVTTLTTAEMQGSEAETNMDGFDFEDVWTSVLESDDDTTADGYPILLTVDREQQLDAQGILSLTAFTISALVNSESVEIQDIFAQVNDEVREVTEAFALINGSVEQI